MSFSVSSVVLRQEPGAGVVSIRQAVGGGGGGGLFTVYAEYKHKHRSAAEHSQVRICIVTLARNIQGPD